jgi:sigma-54 specific flagellar transcriptional regulator A
LYRYQWPGNVRELANIVERLVILFPYGTVDYDDLPEKFQVDGDDLPAAVVTVIDETPASRVMKLAEAKAVIVISDSASGDHLPLAEIDSLPEEGLDLKEHLANLEYLLIKQALDEATGVVAHAANRLKMRRTTLVEKMRKYGIQRDGD